MTASIESTRPPRRWLRRLLLRGTAALALLGLVSAAFVLRDRATEIVERGGAVADARVTGQIVSGAYLDERIELRSTSGLVAELHVRAPLAEGPARPTALILGGVRTGRDAARFVRETRDCVVAALSYPTPYHRVKTIGQALRVRRALIDTPSAILLAVEYLRTRTDVDPDAIELVGVSLGVPFVCVAGALDKKINRVWTVHGGASPKRMLAHALKDDVGSPALRNALGLVLAFSFHGLVLAPEDWVADIAPRPFMMISARDDELIPRECVDLLYESAQEPKEIVWVDGGHVDTQELELVTKLCNMVLERMIADAQR